MNLSHSLLHNGGGFPGPEVPFRASSITGLWGDIPVLGEGKDTNPMEGKEPQAQQLSSGDLLEPTFFTAAPADCLRCEKICPKTSGQDHTPLFPEVLTQSWEERSAGRLGLRAKIPQKQQQGILKP